MANPSVAQFVQVLIGGVTTGSVYALIALGFTLIYSVSRVINLAQGEFVSLGALSVITLSGPLNVPLLPSVLIGVCGVTAVGLLLERFGIRTAKGANLTTLLIITIGASVFLRGVALLAWGRDPYSLPGFSGETPIMTLGAAVSRQTLWVLGTLAAVSFGLWLYFTRSWQGKALIACAENPSAASLIGIKVKRMVCLSFALSAAIGALGGAMVAPITFMTYDAGTMLGLKGFVAGVLGGLGSTWGALAGGLLLGILESLSAGYVSSLFKETVALLVLILVLLTRPVGLFGRARP